MGSIKWYKRDPRAALVGMMGLTLEERGAYNTILDLIYIYDGKLACNDRQIANWLQVDLRKWKRIKGRLLETGKLYIHADCLHNERADQEIHAALLRIASATTSINKRWATHNEIKRLADTSVILPTTTKISYLSARTMPDFKKK